MCSLYGIRYHIITLVAVFLALGLGLLLGGTLGEQLIVKEQEQLLKRLEDRYTQAKEDNANLQKKTRSLEAEERQLEQVTAKVGGHYVQDRLAGQKVAILQLEPADLAPLVSTLEQAGANVTSIAKLTSAAPLLEPASCPLEWREKWGGSSGSSIKARLQQMADQIVCELYGQQVGTMLRELQDMNALTVNGTIDSRPQHVIVVGGAHGSTMQRMLQFDPPLLQALAKQELHTVAAETTAAQNSGVRYYREAGISTVDDLDQLAGRIALIDLLGGANGHFGIKKTAQALLPERATAKEVSTQP